MKLVEGQKLRVKEFNERPEHWNTYGKMDAWMGKIVTLKKDDGTDYLNLIIYEDDRWWWKPSDFQLVFDTWEDVKNAMEEECGKHDLSCFGCNLKGNVGNCYVDLFANKDYEQLAKNFEKMFKMECYVLEDEEMEMKEMEKEFKLYDLKDEMIVKTRNGNMYLVIGDNFVRQEGFIRKCHYKDNMRNNCDSTWDIIAVYPPTKCYTYGFKNMLEPNAKPIWEEKKEIVIPEECKNILKHISEDYKWIAKDSDGDIYLYREKPDKGGYSWNWTTDCKKIDTDIFKDLDFSWLSWEDEEPINFRELLNKK